MVVPGFVGELGSLNCWGHECLLFVVSQLNRLGFKGPFLRPGRKEELDGIRRQVITSLPELRKQVSDTDLHTLMNQV